jgi:hypothetical protein
MNRIVFEFASASVTVLNWLKKPEMGFLIIKSPRERES